MFVLRFSAPCYFVELSRQLVVLERASHVVMSYGLEAWMRSMRWPMRGARSHGDSARRGVPRGAQQAAPEVLGAPCGGNRVWLSSAMLRCGWRHTWQARARAKGTARTSTIRRSRWSSFPGRRSTRSAICSSKRANRCCRARGSPGVGRRSVRATRFAGVSIHTNFKLGLSL